MWCTAWWCQLPTSVKGVQHTNVWNNVIYTDPDVGKEDLWILPGVQHTDVWNNVIYEDPNVGKEELRILPGVQHTDLWNKVIFTDPNVGKGVFGSYRVYTTHRRVKQRHLHRSERR